MSDKTHKRMSCLSQEAHEAAREGRVDDLKRIEAAIDAAVAALWRLSDEEVVEIERSLEEM